MIHNINKYDIKTITTVIYFYGINSQINKAIGICNKIWFNNIDKTELISTIMYILKLNKECTKVINMYFSLKKYNIKFNEHVYSITLHCCGETVNINDGESIINDLNTINDTELSTAVYIISGIISFYAKCSHFNKAISTFNTNINIVNNDNILVLYGTIMDCYTRMGTFEKVFELYYELKSKNLKLNECIYGIILNACSHSGNISEADSVFNDIKQHILYPNNYLITSLIDCYGKYGYLNKSESIYNEYSIQANINDKHKIAMLLSILSNSRLHNDISRANRIYDIIQKIRINNPCLSAHGSDDALLKNINAKLHK